MLNLTFSSILCFFATSYASSNNPVIFQFLLRFPVEISKVKTNLIYIVVFNVLHFGLYDFIQLTDTQQLCHFRSSLKMKMLSKRYVFYIPWYTLWFRITSKSEKHITKPKKQHPRSNVVGRIFPEDLNNNITHLRPRLHLWKYHVFDFQ